MIKYFTIENFLSIKNENILEFDLNIDRDSKYIANPVIGFAGANASGKTTVLRAITFVLWFMQNSFLQIEEDEEIPIEPFCTLEETPTKFHLGAARHLEYLSLNGLTILATLESRPLNPEGGCGTHLLVLANA